MINWIKESNAVNLERLSIFQLSKDTDESIQWISSVEKINESLKILLKLSADKFWSTLVYSPNLLTLLDSLLDFYIRTSLYNGTINYTSAKVERIKTLFTETSQRLFLVYLRILSNLPSNNMSNKEFGDLVRSRRIITVSTLTKVCTIYGKTNSKMLSKLIKNLLAAQPLYVNDLENFVASTKQILDKANFFLMDVVSMFSVTGEHANELMTICDNLINVLLSSASFLSVYRAQIKLWANLLYCIPQLIDSVAQIFNDENLVNLAEYCISSNALNALAFKRSLLIQSIMHFFKLCYSLDVLSEKAKFELIHNNLSCKEFLVRFNEEFNIESEFESFVKHKICSEKEFIEATALVNYAYAEKCRAIKISLTQRRLLNDIGKPENTDVEELLYSLLDLLPNYSIQQLHLCLRHFDYDLEKTTFALMEKEQLPFELRVLLWKTDTFEDVSIDEIPPNMESFVDDLNECENMEFMSKEGGVVMPTFDLAPPIDSRSHSKWNCNAVDEKKEDDEKFENEESLICNDAKTKSKSGAKLSEMVCRYNNVYNMNGIEEYLDSVKNQREEEVIEHNGKILVRENRCRDEISEKLRKELLSTYERYKYVSDEEDCDESDSECAETSGKYKNFIQNLNRLNEDDEYDDTYDDTSRFAVENCNESSDETDDGNGMKSNNPTSSTSKNNKVQQPNQRQQNRGNDRSGTNAQNQRKANSKNINKNARSSQSNAPPVSSNKKKVDSSARDNSHSNCETKQNSNSSYTGGKARQNKERNKGKMRQRGADRKMRSGMF